MELTKFKYVHNWLKRVICLQLYLSLMASPILLYWGLPLSIAAPIGNIIFTPCLTAILFLSSLIFFAKLVYIPCGILIKALDFSTSTMDYLIKLGSHHWLIGFAKPAWSILWAIPLCTLLIMHHRRFTNGYRGIICLSALSLAISLVLIYSKNSPPIKTITCNNGELALLQTKKETILIDPGFLGSRISAPSFVQYRLIPTIIKTAGTTSIDALIVLQTNQMTMQAISTLCTMMHVRNVYLPAWSGTLSIGEKIAYRQLKISMQEHDTKFIPINRQTTIAVHNGSLTIKPLERCIKTKTIEYPALQVSGTIGEQTISYRSKKIGVKK